MSGIGVIRMGLWEELERYFIILDCGCMVYCDSPEQEEIEIEQLYTALENKYGSDFPIYRYDAPEKKPTQKDFYLALMDSVNCQDNSTKDPIYLHHILTQHIQGEVEASNSHIKKAVLIVKNAERLSEKQYTWLIDIYNTLGMKDVRIFTILFGSSKLKEVRKKFITKGKSQIVQRYMVKEFTC